MKNFFLSVSRFFIDNRLLKWMTIILILLVSAASLPGLKRYALPRVSLDTVEIVTVYPGASPLEVEQDVTIEIEEKLESIEGIEKYTSKSSENLSFIRVELNADLGDNRPVIEDIESAVDAALLPEDANKPSIVEIAVDYMPIFEIGFTSKTLSKLQLSEEVRKLRKQILALPDVAEVRKLNVPNVEMHVLVDPKQLERRQVSLLEVVNAIENAKQRLFAGNLSQGKDVKNVITTKSYKNPEEVANIIVRATSGEYEDVIIRVGDLGKVEWGVQEQRRLLSYNGVPGMGIQVTKKKESDVIETVDSVRALLEQEIPNLQRKGIAVVEHRDESLETSSRLKIVYQSLGLGLLLVVGVLALFLSPVVAFWTAMGLPFSILVSLGIAARIGISINSVSLCGIIVTLGILVDNSTVIGESIFKRREEGDKPREGSLSGLSLVIRPMVFAVLTTIAGFLSLLLIEGQIGEFTYEIPLMVFLMLTASLIDSSLFLPSHLAEHGVSKRKPLANGLLKWSTKQYRRALHKILIHPYITLLFAILFLFAGGIGALKISTFSLFSEDQAFEMQINGEIAGGQSKEYVEQQVEKVEKIIDSLPPDVVQSYRTYIGGDFNNKWVIEFRLSQYYDRDMKAEDVKNYLLGRLQNNPDIPISFIDYFINSGGPPAGKPVRITVISNDDVKRKKVIAEVIGDMTDIKLLDIDSNLLETREELTLQPTDAGMLSMISPDTIATTMRLAYEGLKVASVHLIEEKRDIRVKLNSEMIDFSDPLAGIMILNPVNQYVNVKNLVEEKIEIAPVLINRRNGIRQNTITARFDKEETTALEVYKTLQEKYASENRNNDGVKVLIGGEAEETSSTFNSLILALLFSVVLVYGLLVVQFNRLSQPFMVILSIPFGLVGLMYMLTLQGYIITVVAMIGIIGFGGVVINSSIIMVDFINHLLKDAEAVKKDEREIATFDRAMLRDTLRKMIVDGATMRFRPIFITTFTTLAGLMPTAYGIIGNTDGFVSPIAMAMMWGLLFGTTAGLFIVPLFYYINEDIIGLFKRKRHTKVKPIS